MMQAIKLGCVDFVAKPYDEELVQDIVRKHTE